VTDRPIGAGRSSFNLVDGRKLFEALALQPDTAFLDLASGPGKYALAAAQTITEEGVVYAVDLWQGGIEALRAEARARGIDWIIARVADVGEQIPIGDHAVDVCLIASALHDFVRERVHHAALQEVTRVLKPTGKLAVVEFKRMADSPGPPLEVRLAPPDVEALVSRHGFDLVRTEEIGPYHYLSIFLLDRPRNSRQQV
jgi:ubiquinone/menaquinone biosynthesis C-methylase UbiE